MVRFIDLSQLLPRPWKNGKGQTIEIAIEPPHAKFPIDGFDWRLSCADINESGPFSIFDGYDRLLTIWKGHGIELNGESLLPFQCLCFSGSIPKYSELIQGSVRDLGVIFNPKKYRCTMEAFESMDRELKIHSSRNETHFIFCAEGSILCQDRKINAEGFIQLHESEAILIQSEEKSKIIWIKITKLQ